MKNKIVSTIKTLPILIILFGGLAIASENQKCPTNDLEDMEISRELYNKIKPKAVKDVLRPLLLVRHDLLNLPENIDKSVDEFQLEFFKRVAPIYDRTGILNYEYDSEEGDFFDNHIISDNHPIRSSNYGQSYALNRMNPYIVERQPTDRDILTEERSFVGEIVDSFQAEYCDRAISNALYKLQDDVRIVMEDLDIIYKNALGRLLANEVSKIFALNTSENDINEALRLKRLNMEADAVQNASSIFLHENSNSSSNIATNQPSKSGSR